MNKHSPRWEVMVTICTKCGLRGYIFPDQLKHERYTNIKVGQMVEAKCCNRELRAVVKGYEQPERAMRLQDIRTRKTDINQEQAIANF